MTDERIFWLWNGPTNRSNAAHILRFARALLTEAVEEEREQLAKEFERFSYGPFTNPAVTIRSRSQPKKGG